MSFQSREYQNYIISRIEELTLDSKSVILELDCGMGKRVITYRLLTETFDNKKVVVFLQNYSSLQETVHYLNTEYGGIPNSDFLKSGSTAIQRKVIIESNRVILTLPIVFFNTVTQFPELKDSFDIVIINEVDQIVRRISQNRVLVVPWNKLIPLMSNSLFLGMSGTLRDKHTVIDAQDQMLLRDELKTLHNFFPSCSTITIEDFLDTDLKQFIQTTEVYITPVQDEKTREIILELTNNIEIIREEILKQVKDTAPHLLAELKKDFFRKINFMDIETDLLIKFNRLFLLRKYVYSMPSKNYINYLNRSDFNKKLLQVKSFLTGKELKIIEIASQSSKITVLCSYLSTVYSLSQLLKSKGFEIFIVTGSVRDKNRVISQFKECKKPSFLLLSPVGERDLDIPQTDSLIVYDLVNSPKTVYQKMKRSRGGRVYLLFYEDTPEYQKVKRITNEIATSYPWSTIFISK